jgi:hypothetical protein
MARVETRRQPRRPPAAPPAEDAKLEDWFADRLEAQGIPLRMSRRGKERTLAVLALLIAVLGLLWAFSSGGSSSSSTASSAPGATSTATPTSGNGGGGSKTTSFKHRTPPAWNTIQIDVLNGYGGSGAAGTASQTLASQGWKVGNTANAGTTGISRTIVVYAPGHGREAAVVANRLGLDRPLPVTSVQGLSSTVTQGVAIVLGPDGLPTA